MSAKRIYIPQDSAERLIVPVESEFIENLKTLFGVGLFSELKQRLIPLALDILRISLLGHTHPFETLRGFERSPVGRFIVQPLYPVSGYRYAGCSGEAPEAAKPGPDAA